VRSLGLDVGATQLKLALLDGERLVEERQAPTRSEDGGPDAVFERIAELGRGAGRVDSIGVALPGLFDLDGNALLLPNLHGDWRGAPVRRRLEESLGAPVRLINDGHAFVLAEATLGAGRGADDLVGIVCGTGIGGGLMLRGRLHLGAADRSGEFGHHTVVEDGLPCPCGNRGCLELYAGARAIARAAGATSFEETLARASGGESIACGALERAGELIGLALANVLMFVCPDRVVIGGGVAEAGPILLEPVRAAVAARARVAPLDRIDIVAADLGPSAGAVGAALWGAVARQGATQAGPND
jgi:glucokinase